MPDKVVLLNVVWIAGVLLIAFVAHRREWLREKAVEAERIARARAIDARQRKIMRSYERQYVPLPAASGTWPDSARDGFELVDLARLAIDEPPDMPLPKLAEKRRIAPGDLVRAAVVDPAGDEPFDIWILVEARLEQDGFLGIVHETGHDAIARLHGRELAFHANHVAEIARPPAGAARH